MAVTIQKKKQGSVSIAPKQTGSVKILPKQKGTVSILPPQKGSVSIYRPPQGSVSVYRPGGYPQNVQGDSTSTGGGGGGSYDAEAAAYAAKQAEDNRKRGELRGKATGYLDQLVALYNELIGKIEGVGKDSTERINKNYDGKVLEQNELMNEGMYTTDAANAANNLSASSFVAFDRGKVRKAKDANVKVLNEGRSADLATIGKMVSEDVARYTADRDNTGRTRELIGQTEDISELTGTVNNLGNTVASTQAARGKYGTQGEFVSKANSLGNYDTTTLEKNMATIVANTSASPAAKQAAMDDLLGGAPLSEAKKKELKTKYTQVV